MPITGTLKRCPNIAKQWAAKTYDKWSEQYSYYEILRFFIVICYFRETLSLGRLDFSNYHYSPFLYIFRKHGLHGEIIIRMRLS